MDISKSLKSGVEKLMPVLFIGHGSPMNAIEDNEFSRGWKEIAKKVPRPKAILCISAHWETKGIQVLLFFIIFALASISNRNLLFYS
jgi:hypothetical protein